MSISRQEIESRCWKHITFKVLVQACLLFWGIGKPGRDALLWSLHTHCIEGNGSGCDEYASSTSSSSEHVQHHVKWFIGGARVCRRAFLRMLGVGQGRLNRTHGRVKGLDERTLGGSVSNVDLFPAGCVFFVRAKRPTSSTIYLGSEIFDEHALQHIRKHASRVPWQFRFGFISYVALAGLFFWQLTGRKMAGKQLAGFQLMSFELVSQLTGSKLVCWACAPANWLQANACKFGPLNKDMNFDDEAARAELLERLMQDALEGPASRSAKKLNFKQLAARELPPAWELAAVVCLISSQLRCKQDWERKPGNFRRRNQDLAQDLALSPSITALSPRYMWSLNGPHEILNGFWGPCRSAKAAGVLGHLTLAWGAASRAPQGLLTIIYDRFDKTKMIIHDGAIVVYTNFWENSPGEPVSDSNLGTWMGVLR